MITEEEFQQALKDMVDEGKIFAHCPTCELVMSKTAFKKTCCKKCGKVNPDKIMFYRNNKATAS